MLTCLDLHFLSGLGNQFYALEAEVHNEMIECISFIVDLRKFSFRASQV